MIPTTDSRAQKSQDARMGTGTAPKRKPQTKKELETTKVAQISKLYAAAEAKTTSGSKENKAGCKPHKPRRELQTSTKERPPTTSAKAVPQLVSTQCAPHSSKLEHVSGRVLDNKVESLTRQERACSSAHKSDSLGKSDHSTGPSN